MKANGNSGARVLQIWNNQPSYLQNVTSRGSLWFRNSRIEWRGNCTSEDWKLASGTDRVEGFRKARLLHYCGKSGVCFMNVDYIPPYLQKRWQGEASCSAEREHNELLRARKLLLHPPAKTGKLTASQIKWKASERPRWSLMSKWRQWKSSGSGER